MTDTDIAVDLMTIGHCGHDLSRPECILTTREGYIYASHMPLGIVQIAPDGNQTILGNGTPGGFVPNGIAMLRDGSFLIANLGPEGGVWRLTVSGELEPLLLEADGVPLTSANFVLADEDGGLWITNSTRKVPRHEALNKGIADGFIVRMDARGARIVADGIAFSNECRVGPGRAHLYVVETTGRRIARFALKPGMALGARETFVQLGAGDFPDGAVFDSAGHLWVTSVFSNRLYRVSPEGKAHLLLEDSNPDALAAAERAREAGELTVEHLHDAEGRRLINLASVTFGGSDLKTVYLGSIGNKSLGTFRSPVAGLKPFHWDVRR